ncbi:SUKH-3 domain-containing protein [Micromonospora sp. WMMD1082]|uniref:SUKH-3 domain-containing protein n=1 Tax=Micromonospora sp. WMMD1082 TaxID=3016104 RepID=UPI0024161086|nr:SUKH-3 domain-containing protein [Micromonospora sp. WMMD1082]MDG4794503.1 SUKH-3 domain-containing protein [Micromonospora sp. WMMD1082]
MTDRFPPLVAQTLAAAGWSSGRRDEGQAREWGLRIAATAAPDGRQHVVTAAAIEAYAEFGGLRVRPQGEGEQVAPSAFHLDPFLVRHSVETLAELAEATGAPLSPLGEEEGGTGILAVDAEGRVFVLDHTGDWFLGATLDEALTTLVLGRQPQRVRGDGTW